MRQLRDREDVDQVEEQLDRRDRLLDAVAARAQVACRWSAGRHGRRRCRNSVELMRAVVGADAAHEPGRHRDGGHHGRDDRGDGDERHGHHDREDQQGRADQQPEEDDHADLRDAQAAAGHLDDAPRSPRRCVGCPVCGGRTSVVFMTATLPERAAHLVRVGPQSHAQSARPVGHGARWSRSRRARWPASAVAQAARDRPGSPRRVTRRAAVRSSLVSSRSTPGGGGGGGGEGGRGGRRGGGSGERGGGSAWGRGESSEWGV